jgi:DNA-binding NarL/FixJ family response regulator
VGTIAILGSPRNCYQCGHDFQGKPRERVCPDCRKPVGKINISLAAPLSFREKQVVALIITGKINKEIAWELKLTEGTVKEYLNRIFKKVGCTNRTELAMWAVGPVRVPLAEFTDS